MKTDRSQQLFQQGTTLMPGGVSSPVRAFKGVGGTPLFIEKAKGATLWDVDGNRFIDYIGSWGPMILGHGHRKVLRAIKKTLKKGVSFGASCELEIRLAELVCQAFPSVEKVRFVNSGTEAVMGALRAARAFTHRNKIIKFDGCYHGHSDSLLVKAGSGAATLGIPDSAGVPPSFTQETLIAKFNNLESVNELVQKYSGEIAAIILEPVIGNMGVILPRNDFLQKLRQLCDGNKILLIFDEVMTGFRLSLGGAQKLYGVRPDMTTMGKIIGGGLPVGAYGGRKEIMNCVAPEGPAYQAGTLSGNPIAMAAGIATLKILREEDPYEGLSLQTQTLTNGLKEIAEKYKTPLTVERAGSMWTPFFSPGPIHSPDDARKADAEKFKKFFHGMLKNGVMLPPSPFEAAFVSTAHGKKEIQKTLETAEKVLGNF